MFSNQWRHVDAYSPKNHSLLTRTSEILITFVIVCLFSCFMNLILHQLEYKLEMLVIFPCELSTKIVITLHLSTRNATIERVVSFVRAFVLVVEI